MSATHAPRLTEVGALPTSGARAVESFELDGTQLLAIPQLAYDIPGSVQDLAPQHGRALAHFTDARGETYLLVACLASPSRLLREVERSRAANSAELWRETIAVEAYRGREQAIADMVDYACAVTARYLRAALADESYLNSRTLREDYLEGGPCGQLPVPVNQMMIATFFLAGLDISHRTEGIHRRLRGVCPALPPRTCRGPRRRDIITGARGHDRVRGWISPRRRPTPRSRSWPSWRPTASPGTRSCR
ncbi:DUF5624 domain-containing protein [Streptomyces sp. NBC_01515]|uniref:DUF5624 domain-containing protein n=1 Tax=Streptomyces sp. NBC_01515 TaxID=2903890 RepID=UPI00386894C3